ncbi:WD40 repeat domain-containing protein [Thiothrix sp.]|jgi:WD40 repeat protein|uniref:WD40 repeat domain-containing protein n=1 Tax=Thiothrix sp. TaxID=1032 RepID=UPI00257A36D1|nr:WD40 repeat domain-containing protein [Thiothrix sp.]
MTQQNPISQPQGYSANGRAKIHLERHSGHQHFLLCIDQFEELFTRFRSDPDTIKAYITQLVRLVTTDISNCTLLLVMRADFVADVLAYEDLAKLLDISPVKLLPPMGRAELRAAIEQPASKQRIRVELALTEALLDAVKNQSGSLPLLQHVLRQLWTLRNNNTLHLNTYNQLGGLEKALEIYADSTIEKLKPAEKEKAKHIFLRLIQLGDGSEDTRRRADRREFGDIPSISDLLNELVNSRLITAQQDEYSLNIYIEVSHEALIRHWGRLREWISENRDALRIQHQISLDTKKWHEAKHNAAWLLTGLRLVVAENWVKLNMARASELEAEFIEASIDERDRQAHEKEQQQQREFKLLKEKQELAEQKAEEQRKLLGVMVVISIIMLLATSFAWYFSNESILAKEEADNALVLAEKNSKIAKQQELQANSNLAKAFEDKALFWFSKGTQTNDTTALRKGWLYALKAQTLETSNHSTVLDASLISDLSKSTGEELFREMKSSVSPSGFWGDVSKLVYSPDGHTLALLTSNTIYIIDANSGATITTLTNHDNTVTTALTYSPDGKLLASSEQIVSEQELNESTLSGRSKIYLWDLQSGKLKKILNEHNGIINTLVYSHDGSTIATGSDDQSICLWDTESGELKKILKGHAGPVMALAYRQDGNILASSAEDKTVRWWDTNSGQIKKIIDDNELDDNSFAHISYSPDGQSFAIADNKSIKFLDVNNGVLQDTLMYDHDMEISSFSYKPDAQEIAIGNTSGEVYLWNVKSKKINNYINGYDGGESSPGGLFSLSILTYNPTGKNLAFGWGYETRAEHNEDTDSRIMFWDTEENKIIKKEKDEGENVYTVAYSPTGANVASGSADGKIRIWNPDTGLVINTLDGHEDEVICLTYSHDGKILASGSADNTVKLWDTKTWMLLKTLEGHSDRVVDLSFNANDEILASGAFDNTIRLWNIKNGVIERILNDHVIYLDFSPKDNTLVSSSGGSSIHIWDTASGKLQKTLETDGTVTALQFSSEGTLLASGDYGDFICLWDTKNFSLLRKIKSPFDIVNDLAFSPDGETLAVAHGDAYTNDIFNQEHINYKVGIFDVLTGNLKSILPGHQDGVTSIAYSPDGEKLTSGSTDDTVRFWDAKSNQWHLTLNKDETSTVFAISPDDQYFVLGQNNGYIEIWNTHNNSLKKKLDIGSDGVTSLEYSQDGSILAIGTKSGTIQLWDAKAWVLNKKIMGHKKEITSIAYSKSGSILATGSSDYDVKLWNINTGSLYKTLDGHQEAIVDLAFNKRDDILAFATNSKIKVWDIASGTLKQRINSGSYEVLDIAFHDQDQLFASVLIDKNLHIWDVGLNKVIDVLGHEGSISSSFSEDGNYFVVAENAEPMSTARYGAIYPNSHMMQVWDIKLGEILLEIDTGNKPIHYSGINKKNSMVFFASDIDRAANASESEYTFEYRNINSAKLLTKFDPTQTLNLLSFIWELSFNKDNLDFDYLPRVPSLFPIKGYYYSNTEYRELLDAPPIEKTKTEQIISFLEKNCFYRDIQEKNNCHSEQNNQQSEKTKGD